jgi:uroporphyrinogen III methyltransferase / synthase
VAKILVTRPRDRAGELTSRLRQLGHDVLVQPLIETAALGDEAIDVAGYDWVIVTSARGARELRRRARGTMPRVAAIGRATATAMGGADFVPRVATQEGLLTEFPKPPGRVLVAAAEGARRLIADTLGADFVALYRTRELAIDALPECDLIVVASASSARALARVGTLIPVVSIGPETTRVAIQQGLVVAAEAKTHDLDGLIAAVETATHNAS